MNREILFRGKRTDNGEWVEGYLFQVGGTCFILLSTDRAFDYPEKVFVRPETVGQFTGLLDKNGKRIFEGDILTSKFGDGKPYSINFGPHTIWDEWGVSNAIGFYTYPENESFGLTIDGNSNAYTVIGNIHDSPELVGKEEPSA